MDDNPYIDESKLLHHVAVLTPQEVMVFGDVYKYDATYAFEWLCNKAHCNRQQVYRVSWADTVGGGREYILDVDPTRIIHEVDNSSRPVND